MVATRRSAKAAAEPAPAPQNTLKAPPKRAPARKKAVAQEPAVKPAPAVKAVPAVKATPVVKAATAVKSAPAIKAAAAVKPAPVVKAAPVSKAKNTTAVKRKAEEEPETLVPAPKRVTRSKAVVVEPVELIKKPAPRARKAAVPKPAPVTTSKKPVRGRAVAPMTTKAALNELPGYPTTPAHIKAPMSNKEALAALAGYPTTPAHVVAPMGTQAALAELPSYPTTPGHIVAPISNTTGLAALPGYPTTPAHIVAPVSNKDLLAKLAGYPTTPAHIQTPVLPSVAENGEVMEDVEDTSSLVVPSFMAGVDDNSLFIDKEDLSGNVNTPARVQKPLSARTPLAELPLEDLNTPAQIVVRTPTTIGMGELGPDCSGTPLYITTPVAVREASRELSEAPQTPITNQEAFRELPSYPTTPAIALEAAIQEEITASVKKQTPSPSRFANPPEVSFASTEDIDIAVGDRAEVDTGEHAVEPDKEQPSSSTSFVESLDESFASAEGSGLTHGDPMEIDTKAHLAEPVREGVRLSDIDFLQGPRATFEPYNPDRDDFAPPEDPSDFSSSQLQSPVPQPDSAVEPVSNLQLGPIQLSAPLPVVEPMSPKKSALRSPQKLNAKTPKKAVTFNDEDVEQSNMFLCEGSPLRGVTIFVDVTSNGKQNNYIFTSYLEDLGATIANECVTDISHVLFKDGSISTLEKVIASKGAIKCVNIGWVLKCEEEKKRVDESDYLVDLTPAMPKSPSPIKMNPFTPARTPSRYALPPSSQCGSIPTTPTSSEIDRSITLDEDKENDVSETDIFCGTNGPRTCPTKKTSVLFGRSALKTPSRARNLFGLSSRQPLSEGKKRSFDSSSLGLSMSVPPKKPRLFA